MRCSILLLLVGCGGAPTVPKGPTTEHIIQAPEGVERWEPSGAAVLGDTLWVADDRDGKIAAYALPLKAGVNTPTAHHQLTADTLAPVRDGLLQKRLPPMIAKLLRKRLKFEGMARAKGGGLLILESISRTVFRCADPAAGCPQVEAVDVEGAHDKLLSLLDGPVAYFAIEGLATVGDRVLLGTRGRKPKGGDENDFQAWPFVLSAGGAHAYDGKPWVIGEKPHGISDLAHHAGDLWMTWTYEMDSKDTKDGVASVLAMAELDEGLPERPEVCRSFEGKAEAVAVWGDKLIVLFDNDRARKKRGDPTRFDVDANQDFVKVLPRRCD